MQSRDFERFFKDHYSRAYYYAASIVHDDEAARDIVADSFEYLFTHCAHQEATDAVNYLFVIIRNKSYDLFRRQQVHQRYAEFVAQDGERATSFDAKEHEEKVERVMAMIDDLSPRTQEILRLHYLEGRTYDQVAQRLGISASAVKKHIMQALKTFRERIGGRRNIAICSSF